MTHVTTVVNRFQAAQKQCFVSVAAHVPRKACGCGCLTQTRSPGTRVDLRSVILARMGKKRKSWHQGAWDIKNEPLQGWECSTTTSSMGFCPVSNHKYFVKSLVVLCHRAVLGLRATEVLLLTSRLFCHVGFLVQFFLLMAHGSFTSWCKGPLYRSVFECESNLSGPVGLIYF